MIATWMIYCATCAVALSLAALLAEKMLIAGRAPVRLVWIGAVTLSLAVPAVALRFAPRVMVATPPAVATTISSEDGPLSQTVGALPLTNSAGVASAPESEPVAAHAPASTWRDALARADQTLAIIWVTLSLALIVNFVGGVVTLAMLRRTWERQTVLGVPVYVSDHSGPAVVGVLTPSIVLPRWVLSLDEAQLSLMLRHEQEHRRAGDGRLLTMARLALIAMPWNFALWWQMVRLRVAVEMDCDARVLQEADARTYGDLLLEVAGARRGPFLREATAFAERATQLERRIRMLPRHRVRTSRLARVASLGIALAAVFVACVAPRPSVPARTPVMPPSIASMSPSAHEAVPIRDSQVTPPPVATLPSRSTRMSTLPALIRTSFADSVRAIPVLPDTDTTRGLPRPGAGPALASQQVDSLFKRLFADISLSADQEAQARQLLRLREQQRNMRRVVGNVTILGNFVKAAQVLTRRDSALRLLLTNDTDRATFDARRTIRGAGGRGRSGGGGFDSLVALSPGAGGRGAGGGRGGRGGGGGDSSGARMGGGGRSGGGARGNIGGTLRGDSVVADFYIDGNLVWRGSDSASIAGLTLPVDSARVARQSEAAFHRFFDGLALSAVQDSSARAIITRAQRESMEFTRFVAPTDLRLEVARSNLSQAASDSAVLAIVTNPADRAKLEARLRTPP